MPDLDFESLLESQGDVMTQEGTEEQDLSLDELLEGEGDVGVVVPYSEEEPHPLAEAFPGHDVELPTVEDTPDLEGFFEADWDDSQLALTEAEELEGKLQHRVYEDFTNLWKSAEEKDVEAFDNALDDLGLPTVPRTWKQMREVTTTTIQGLMMVGIGAAVAVPALTAGSVGAGIVAGLSALVHTGVGVTGFWAALQGLDLFVRKIKGYEHVEGVERGFVDLWDTTHMPDSTLWFLETVDEAVKLMAFGMAHKASSKAVGKYVPRAKMMKAIEGLLRETIKVHGPNKGKMQITAEELMSSLNILDVKNIEPKTKKALTDMGISQIELALRQRYGLPIEVPAEKIVYLHDKPFWKNLKKKFRLSPYEGRRVEPFKVEGETAQPGEGPKIEPYKTETESAVPVDKELDPEYTPGGQEDMTALEEKYTLGEIEAEAEGLEIRKVDPDVAKAKGEAKPFEPGKVETVGVQEAIDKGIIDKDTGELIQTILKEFPDAWAEHFDVAISNQEFAPTAEQLKAHGVPKRQSDDMRIHGALFTEKMGPMLQDAKHVAVMFKGSNVGTFFHEFGHFVEKRLLSKTDRGIVNKFYTEYKKAPREGNVKKKDEWFADEFREWWFNGLYDGKIRNSKDVRLANIFRRTLRAAKNIWKNLRAKGKTGPLDTLFEDVITNGRELNEKLYFSEAEMVSKYVVGEPPTEAQVRNQGLHDNQKTWVSYDPSTQCPKQVAFVDFMLKTAKEYGLEVKDLADNKLIADMYDLAIAENIDVPCSYCYVEAGRMEAIRFHREGKTAAQVGASQAKKVTRKIPYTDKVLKWSDSYVESVNKRGGLRLFSFSDYIRESHQAEISTLLAHAKQRGVGVKAITKNPQFVEDFGDTGITINLSVDYNPKGGVAIDWDVAIALQKKYPNVKIRTVARNPAEVEWFLTNDKIDIDVVTPFHGRNSNEFVDMSGNSKGGKKLRAMIEENPKWAEKVCCQVGGRCFSEAHQKQCASNCGLLADNLSIPADIGNVREIKPKSEDIGLLGKYTQDKMKMHRLKQSGLEGFDSEGHLTVETLKGTETIQKALDNLGYTFEGLTGNPGVDAVLNSQDGLILKQMAYDRFKKIYHKDIRSLLKAEDIAVTAEVRKNIDTFEPFATVKRMSFSKNGDPIGIPEAALLERFELDVVEQLKTKYPELVRVRTSKKIPGTKTPIDQFAQEHGWADADNMVDVLVKTMPKSDRVRIEADAILRREVGEAAHPEKKAQARQTYKWTKKLEKTRRKKFNVTKEDLELLLEEELKVLLEQYFEYGEDMLPEIKEAPYDPSTPPRDLEPQWLDQSARDAAAKQVEIQAEKDAKAPLKEYEPEVEAEGAKEARLHRARVRVSERAKKLAERHTKKIVRDIEADIGKVDYENDIRAGQNSTESIEAELNKDEILLRRSYKTGNLLRSVRALEKKIEKMKFAKLEAKVRLERKKIHSDMVRWSKMESMHPEARKVLAEMAGGIDPVGRRQKTIRKMESTIAWMNEAVEMGEEIPWEHDWLVRTLQEPIDSLFINDMRALHDVAKNVAHLGKLKQKLINSKIQRDFMKSQESRLNSIEYHNKLKPKLEGLEAIEQQSEVKGTLSNYLQMWGANLKKVEYTMRHLDGRKDGANQEMVEWVVDADMRKENLNTKIFGKLEGLFSDNGLGSKWARKKTEVEGLGQVSNIKRIAIALHSRAKGNREAMLGNKVYRFTEKILDANLRDLSPAERAVVEGIWQLFEKEIWPLLSEAHVKMTGLEPEFVDGYYPLNFDPKLAVEARHMQDVQVGRETLFHHRKVKDGMVQKRQGGQLPPDLSLEALHRSISDAIHYITHSSVVRDMNKVTRDPQYGDAVQRATSIHHWREIQNFVKQTASPFMTENRGGSYDKLFGKLRRNYTMYALGLNVAVSAKQALSLSNLIASRDVGPKALAKGLANYLKNPVAAHRYVKEMSPEMATRSRGHGYERDMMRKFSQELNPLRSKWGVTVDYFKDFTMSLIRMVDMFATTVSWLAGEAHGLEKFNGDQIMAIRQGNRAVRRTQPSGKERDLPPLMRKGELGRAISMFYSFLSVVYNMNSEAVHGLIKDGRIGHFLAALTFVNILPGIAAKQIDVGAREHRLLTGTEMATGAISLPLAGIPLVRDIGNYIINDAQDKYQRYSFAPYQRAFEATAQMPGNVIDDLADEEYMGMAMEIMDLAMMVTGMPGMQVKRTIKGAEQIASGDTDDFTRLAFPE